MNKQQPEALRLANVCSNLTRYSMDAHLIAAELRRLAKLEAEIAAVGAGGVSVPAREHDLQDVRCECCGYMTYHREHMGCIHAARAPAESVLEDAACWHWIAEYLVGTRTDLDDEIVASETVNDLRKLVKAAIKQGEKK